MADEREFRVRPGRIRSTRAQQARPFIAQALAAAKKAGGGVHVAFVAKDRKAVDAFHAAALKAGAKDNGKPGLREDYAPTYYAAFVIDADGNNVEAVCMK